MNKREISVKNISRYYYSILVRIRMLFFQIRGKLEWRVIMFEEKDSFWKKKGFYLAVCTALVCVLGIGTVYYRMNYKNNNGKNLFADSATSKPVATSGAAGGSAINSNNSVTDKSSTEPNVSVAQNNVSNTTGQPAGNTTEGNQPSKADEKKTDKESKTTDKPVMKTSIKDKEKNSGKDEAKTASSKKKTKKPEDNS